MGLSLGPVDPDLGVSERGLSEIEGSSLPDVFSRMSENGVGWATPKAFFVYLEDLVRLRIDQCNRMASQEIQKCSWVLFISKTGPSLNRSM